MQTLTRRTNVLFTPDEHRVLVKLAQESKQTMGELIRQAVRKTYVKKPQDTFEASLLRIRKLTKNIRMKRLDYRALVTEGRKYED